MLVLFFFYCWQIFKNLFEEGLEIQKQRLKDLRAYAQEKRAEQRREHQNELESMENYYKDQVKLNLLLRHCCYTKSLLFNCFNSNTCSALVLHASRSFIPRTPRNAEQREGTGTGECCQSCYLSCLCVLWLMAVFSLDATENKERPEVKDGKGNRATASSNHAD